MLTIVETEAFQRYAAMLWSDSERIAFIIWIAENPMQGDIIAGSGGLRKVRWTYAGKGKRGGVRVIFYPNFSSGEIFLLIVYAKAKFDNLPLSVLAGLKKDMQDG